MSSQAMSCCLMTRTQHNLLNRSTSSMSPSRVLCWHLSRYCHTMTCNKLDTIIHSAWKFSWKTAKKPNLDWTQTCQDRKFWGPGKTVTAVWSLVYLDFQIFEDWERLVYLRSTSLSTFKIQAFLGYDIIFHTLLNTLVMYCSNKKPLKYTLGPPLLQCMPKSNTPSPSSLTKLLAVVIVVALGIQSCCRCWLLSLLAVVVIGCSVVVGRCCSGVQVATVVVMAMW